MGAIAETDRAEVNLDRQLLARTVDCPGGVRPSLHSLSEELVAELRKCIRTNLDCADICAATANVFSRYTGYDSNIAHSAAGLRPGVPVLWGQVRRARRDA